MFFEVINKNLNRGFKKALWLLCSTLNSWIGEFFFWCHEQVSYQIWIQDPIFDGIKLGLTDEDIKNCADEVGLTKGKLLSQSLLPKSLGRGIEPSFMDFVNLVKKGKKMAQKVENRPAFMEGIPKELSRAAEVVNESYLRKSELPSANFHASAKSLAKLGAKYLVFSPLVPSKRDKIG